ncbi:NUDIX hydrolase, partial [Listeria monocytogenes]|nr:NUDIX hydrolase [Listeria monocytogenes]
EYLPYLEKVGELYRFNADAEAGSIYF